MKIDFRLTDDAILNELGARLRARRLQANLSQDELAEQAGLNRKVIARIEAGGQTNSISLIRLLRALGLLESLDQLVPQVGPTPIELFNQQQGQKQRQRASSRRQTEADTPSKQWQWAE